jgi:hypothetical protein
LAELDGGPELLVGGVEIEQAEGAGLPFLGGELALRLGEHFARPLHGSPIGLVLDQDVEREHHLLFRASA